MKEQRIIVEALIVAPALKKGATIDRMSIPITTKGIIPRTSNKSSMTLLDMVMALGKNTIFNVKIMVVTRTMVITL